MGRRCRPASCTAWFSRAIAPTTGRATDVLPGPGSEPRRDRRARDPRPARARDRGCDRVLDRRRRRLARASRRPRGEDRAAARGAELPLDAGDRRRREDDRLRGDPSRLRLPVRERRLRPRVRGERPRLHRTARGRDGAHGRQGAGEGGDARRRRPARPRHRRNREPPRGTARRGGARLSRAPEGGGGRRRPRHAPRCRPGGDRRRVLARLERSGGRLRRRHALCREGDHAGAARRDPGDLRHVRQRPDLRRARVLDPAPSPEADRGVAVAGARPGAARGDGARRRARVCPHRLSECRHVRVPRWAGRRFLVHRAERPAPGRASGDRARDARSTSFAPRSGSPPASRSNTAGARRARAMQSRCASTRKTRVTTFVRHPDS